MSHDFIPARRRILSAAAGTTPCSSPASSASAFAQPKEFKIGFFIALSGPAALFGPTQRACADLAAEKINKAGGIMGRPVRLIFTDAGGPPAETAKSAVRLMLEDKVDLFIGSHDSATREANIATIKAKVPYIYSPVYEGGECSPNVYCLGETPPQQAQPATEFLAKEKNAKTLLPDRRRLRLAAQVERADEEVRRPVRRQGVGEEYVPFGAPNKFEEAVTRIKGAKPDAVVATLVGADNVNFNRTFAGFGLDKSIARLSLLLEENTLLGHRRREQRQPLLVHGLLRQQPGRRREEVQGRVHGQVRRQGAAARDHRCRLLLGVEPRQGAVRQGRREPTRRSSPQRPRAFRSTARRRGDDARPPGRQGHVPRECKGTEFEVFKTIKAVKSGTACRA